MLPDAYLTHFIQGRMRVRIPSKKGDEAYFLSLKDRFARFPGVQKIELNPLTGSVLVLHNLDIKSLDKKLIAEYTELNALFKLDISRPDPASIAAPEKISETYREANEKIRKFTDGEIDLPTLVFTGLLGAGIFEVGRGNVGALPWHVALWYALNVFLQSQRGKGNQS
ncbi:MAG: HMA2 domain-containing protein [Nitrospiria bacterium]